MKAKKQNNILRQFLVIFLDQTIGAKLVFIWNFGFCAPPLTADYSLSRIFLFFFQFAK